MDKNHVEQHRIDLREETLWILHNGVYWHIPVEKRILLLSP
jgi:hypothetical protein